MTAESTTASGRAAAEQLMTDACRIERTGPVTTSPDGTDTTPVQVLYEGVCRIRPAGTAGAGAVADSATAPAETWQHKVSVPYAAGTGVRAGDRVTVTASQDPTLTGLQLRVRSIDRGTHITARRLWCTEVSR